ncbi:MAG: ECF-type sigma factor [Dokdonella sp.]
MGKAALEHAAKSANRGGDALCSSPAMGADEAVEVLALDRALQMLEDIDARACRVVQLHFFAGMTFAEIGALEGLNERTIKRDWEAARRLLCSEMSGGASYGCLVSNVFSHRHSGAGPTTSSLTSFAVVKRFREGGNPV